MRHGAGRLAVAAGLVLGLTGCGLLTGEKKAGAAGARKDVSEVAFVDASGVRRTLADFRGKVVIVDVWATWCPPCRASLPEVAALQQKGGGTYEVLAISVDKEGWEKVSPFLAERSQMGLKAVLPADRSALEPFGAISGIPTTLVVDREGRLRERWSGFYAGRAEEALKAALDEK